MSGADDQRGADESNIYDELADLPWMQVAAMVGHLRAELADREDLMEVAQREMDRLRALNKSLRVELAETRDRRDYLQGQLDIIYDAEYSRNDALKRRIEKMGAAGDALADALDTFLVPGAESDPEAWIGVVNTRDAWRSVRGDAPTGPPADDTAAPDVQVWQSGDGDWGWACARCDYRSVAWWSDRAVAERAAVEHGRDHCPARGSAPASTDGETDA